MQAMGLLVAEPQDLLSGGFNLLNPLEVGLLCHQMREWARLGYYIVLHIAVPCSTFAPARDRSVRTRVRSPAMPEGFRPMPDNVRDGNIMAYIAASLVLLVVTELGGSASIENPLRSYLWKYYALLGVLADVPGREVVFHQCRYGTPWKKPTLVHFWGAFRPLSLNRTCKTSHCCGYPVHTCGRAFHV